MLDDGEMASCTVPIGEYEIMEIIPPGQVLFVFCEDLPEMSSIDTENGKLNFSVEQEGDHVDCLFFNSPAELVTRVMDEPAGGNCEFGGIKVETGLDTNQNGLLDDAEVDPNGTFFICNGAPGEPGPGGPQGPTGDDGGDGEDGDDGLTSLTDIDIIPAGEQCPNGGLEIKTGIDSNSNGVLDPEEVTDTSIVCNGEDGENGNNGCVVAGSGVSTAGLTGLLIYVLIPGLILIRRISRNRKK